MSKFTQLKPNQIVTNKHYIKKGREFVLYEGISGFLAKNFQIKAFKKLK